MPRSTSSPAAGLWRSTLLPKKRVASTLSPAASRISVASSPLLPTTSGTTTSGIPADTWILTVLP